MINFTKRYAKKVEEMAAAETRPERKKELEMMANSLNWVTENPARTFHEALQGLFLYQICLALEGNMHGMSWGRLDQYLGDYYERDIANGTITPEYAQEMLDMFFLKVAEMNKFWGDSGEYGVPGYTSGQGGPQGAGIGPVLREVGGEADELRVPVRGEGAEAGGHGRGGPVGHFCTNYNKAIRVGFGNIKAEADEKMRLLEEKGVYGDGVNKYYFYKSISLVCEGMMAFTPP